MPTRNAAEPTQAERRRLEELLAALRSPCSFRAEPGFLSQTFIEDFQTRLLATHYFLKTELVQDAFEAAFIESAITAGMSVSKPPSGQRFWDVQIDGRKISLKSTKARSLRANTLHISKLCEAAWIQDCRTRTARRDRTVELFNEYCGSVDSIIQARFFQSTFKYQLVEIPVALFRDVLTLQPKHFTSESSSIDIPVGDEVPNFTLKLDRSDAKITIAKVNINSCNILAEWELS